MRVCAEVGCPELTTTTRCTQHTRDRDRARGSRQQRGYNRAYDIARQAWIPTINSGRGVCAETTCLEPTRTIPAGAPFDLAHSVDRTQLLGPAHPRCNRAAAGRHSHQKEPR